MKGLVENAMNVSQGKMPMYGGDAEYQWSCAWHLRLSHDLISKYEPQLNHREDSLQSYQLQSMAISSPWGV